MTSHEHEITYAFRATGDQAEINMERLIAYARTLGGFAISEVGSFEALEEGTQTASEYLRMLLIQPGPYRDQWTEHVERSRKTGEVSRAAVARVISDFLAERLRLTGEKPPSPRQLKDRVNRALTGYATGHTLELFGAAFGFTDEEKRQLWAYYTQDEGEA